MVWAISGAQGMLCLLRQIQFWLHRIGFIARQVVILGLVEEIVQQRRVLCRAVCGGGCGMRVHYFVSFILHFNVLLNLFHFKD